MKMILNEMVVCHRCWHLAHSWKLESYDDDLWICAGSGEKAASWGGGRKARGRRMSLGFRKLQDLWDVSF